MTRRLVLLDAAARGNRAGHRTGPRTSVHCLRERRSRRCRWPSAIGRRRPITSSMRTPWRSARALDYVARAYARGDEQVDAFVGYDASQRQGASIHSPMNCLPAAGWQPLSSSRLSIDAGRRRHRSEPGM